MHMKQIMNRTDSRVSAGDITARLDVPHSPPMTISTQMQEGRVPFSPLVGAFFRDQAVCGDDWDDDDDYADDEEDEEEDEDLFPDEEDEDLDEEEGFDDEEDE